MPGSIAGQQGHADGDAENRMGQISSNSNFVHLPPLPRYMDSKKEIEWMRDRKGSDAASVDASNDRYVPYVKRMGDKTFKVNDYCVRGFFMNSEIKVACTLFADNSIAFWDNNFNSLSIIENENIVDTVCILKSHIIIAEHREEQKYHLRSLSFFLETDTVIYVPISFPSHLKTSTTEIVAVYPTVLGSYGFLAVTNTGSIIIFTSENESWKVESTMCLNTYVVCCDKTDSKLFLYTRDCKIFTMDLLTGSTHVYSTNVTDGISIHGFSAKQREYVVVVGKQSFLEVTELETEKSNYMYAYSCVCILRDGDPILVLAGTYFERLSVSCLSLPELEKRGLLQKTGPLVSGIYSLYGFSEEYSLLVCYTYGTVTPMLLDY